MAFRVVLISCLCAAMISGKVLDWPGKNEATNADKQDEFPTNLSGLFYYTLGSSNDSEKYLFAVVNDPSTLYKLYWSGKNWLPLDADGWTNGKSLSFSGGKGNPDSEDLTLTSETSQYVYVASEKDNDDDTTKRISVLMFDVSVQETSLSALKEWSLTELNDISTDPNNGIEAITWIPDEFLVANGLYDASKKCTYEPSDYPHHGSGLFFVGMESKLHQTVRSVVF